MVKPAGGNEHRVEYDEPHRLPPEVDLEPLVGEGYPPAACAVRVNQDDDGRPIVAVEWLEPPTTGHLVAAILAAGRLAQQPMPPTATLRYLNTLDSAEIKAFEDRWAALRGASSLAEARQRPCYCGKIGDRHFPGAPGCAIPAPETMESALCAASKLVERLRAMHAPHSDPDQRSRCRTCIVGYDARVGDLVHDSFPCATRRLVDELAGPVLG